MSVSELSVSLSEFGEFDQNENIENPQRIKNLPVFKEPLPVLGKRIIRDEIDQD